MENDHTHRSQYAEVLVSAVRTMLTPEVPVGRDGICPARKPWVMAHVIPVGATSCTECEEVFE